MEKEIERIENTWTKIVIRKEEKLEEERRNHSKTSQKLRVLERKVLLMKGFDHFKKLLNEDKTMNLAQLVNFKGLLNNKISDFTRKTFDTLKEKCLNEAVPPVKLFEEAREYFDDGCSIDEDYFLDALREYQSEYSKHSVFFFKVDEQIDYCSGAGDDECWYVMNNDRLEEHESNYHHARDDSLIYCDVCYFHIDRMTMDNICYDDLPLFLPDFKRFMANKKIKK